MYDSDCKVCKKEVKRGDKGIECQLCDDWYHTKCVGISSAVYKELVQGNDNLLWVGDCCKDKFRKSKKTEAKNIENLENTKTDKVKQIQNYQNPIINNEWKLVRNSKSKNQNNRNNTSQMKTNTENRFQVLGDVNEKVKCEYTLIGDSIIKGQDLKFCQRGSRTRRAFCLPGAKIDQITEVVQSLGEDRGTIIAHVGINNIVSKPTHIGETPRALRNSEEVYKAYKKLIEKLKTRREKSILVSILPRPTANREISSRISGMNNRVQDICEKAGIEFVDMTDHFERKPWLYDRDGTHLSTQGKNEYCRVLESSIRELGF